MEVLRVLLLLFINFNYLLLDCHSSCPVVRLCKPPCLGTSNCDYVLKSEFLFSMSGACVLLSHICLLYWHKHIFITATITVPIYLQAAGWPVICSVSCSLNNIVSDALIVDDILALMLGKDSAWPPSTKNFVTGYFLPSVLGGNSLLGTCWFCHEWAVFDATRAAGWKARVQGTSLVNLRGIQQVHMLTLKRLQREHHCKPCSICMSFSFAEHSLPPTCSLFLPVSVFFFFFPLELSRLLCTHTILLSKGIMLVLALRMILVLAP